MSHRRARLGLAVAAVAAGVVATAPAGVAAPAGAPAPEGPTVTLLTGDKVTLGGARGVHVQAAEGREDLGFYVREDEDGDTHVIPTDAIVLLSQGKLDPRLFDVSELVRAGYDDASRDRLPLIVDYPGKTPRSAGVQVNRELPAMSAAAVSAERTAAVWPTLKDAEHVWLDGPVRASLDHSVPQIGAPEAWNAGHTGAGTTVAVLDSGIDVTHPDLADAVAGARNFSGSDTETDNFGHGTHVASIITGSGAASGGRYRGVAPDAKLLNGKVLDDFGFGFDSWIIAGMEWAAGSGADVVNMSLGTQFASDGTDPMSQAVNRLTAETGVLFVVAAGNSGGLVGSPGAADAALTVGAVDRDDQLTDFSSRGRLNGGIKPDVTAPGMDIVAAKAANGQIGKPAGDGYVSLPGTSMAAPHVAGAAAILAGQHPDWQAGQLKNTLMGSAKPNDSLSVFEQGAGRVDVAAATKASVFATQASFDVGTVQWPHDDDQPIATTVTYTNTGAEPVTLNLSMNVTGPDGSPAPQGMFTFTAAQLTVPAGGQASTTVTTDTKVDATDGVYSGAIVATGGGQSTRTPLTVTREVESYDVTLTFLDRDGSPTSEYSSAFRDVNVNRTFSFYDPSGTVVARLPKGEYYFSAAVITIDDEGGYVSADFSEPVFTVTGAGSFVVDARKAKPAGFTIDNPTARTGHAFFRFARPTAWGVAGFILYLPNFDNAMVAPSTTRKDGYTFTAQEHKAQWNGESFDGSPYLYNLQHRENGAVPQTLRWTAHDKDLAKVRSEHAATVPGAFGVREEFLLLPLPATLTEYYTPNVPFEGSFDELPDLELGLPVADLYQSAPRTFKLGRTTTDRWNFGVHGPAFPNSGYYAFARLGNEVRFDLPLVTDQGKGRMGFPGVLGRGRTTLLRDGAVVDEQMITGPSSFKLAPERAKYTLRSTVDQSALARLSTQVSSEWTFTSEHVSGSQPAHLPLLAVRFSPKLDNQNAAPAGKRFTFPVCVERNGAAEPGRVNTPTVEVSYDDGRTWQAAKVKRAGSQWTATVDHPSGAEFVSLRSNITDPSGNAQSQTIIRAYALK